MDWHNTEGGGCCVKGVELENANPDNNAQLFTPAYLDMIPSATMLELYTLKEDTSLL